LATGALNESAISLENNDDDSPDQAYGNDFETNRRYLTFSWWLLHRGWRDMMLKVQAAVKEVFGPLSPRDDITLERFSELTLEVRKRVEGLTEADRKASRWLKYLLPSRDLEDFVLKESGMTSETSSLAPQSSNFSVTPLRRLLDETSDLVDSPPFAHVLTLLLDAGFSLLVDQKISQQSFKVPPTSDITDLNAPRVQEVVDARPVKLPIVLATLTRQAHKIGNGVPNEYLQAMEQVRDLEAFAAVVYSSNWEAEITPLRDESDGKDTKGKGAVGNSNASRLGREEDSILDSDSVIDVGRASNLESAWGKAVETVERPSTA
jgi:peroxin-3